MERELHCLPMVRSLLEPIPDISLPEGYSIIPADENIGELWESVMEDANKEVFLPGTFKGMMVSHPWYRENQVFLMLNEKCDPIATVAAWPLDPSWHRANDSGGSVIHVAVIHTYRGRRLAMQMVYHALHEHKKRGRTFAELSVLEGNYPAIKTYINCGFTPTFDEPTEREYWQKQFFDLNLPRFEGEMRLVPQTTNALPPIPWPYQLGYFSEAERSGLPYTYGLWFWHHLFFVVSTHHVNLKHIIRQSAHAAPMISAIAAKTVLNVFTDRPVDPGAVLMELSDGTLYLVGKSDDSRFVDGVHEYIAHRARPKFEGEGIQARLIDNDFFGIPANPRIVEGLVYGTPMSLPQDGAH